MTRRIVTGVDGSTTASAAARIAAELARALGGELHVLSAYGHADTERRSSEGIEIVLDHKEDARHAVSQGIDELQRDFPDLVVKARISEGRPANALVDAAEEIGADLIVVGNKRVQGVARVLGSIASAVARKAPCDVYIAHTH